MCLDCVVLPRSHSHLNKFVVVVVAVVVVVVVVEEVDHSCLMDPLFPLNWPSPEISKPVYLQESRERLWCIQ